MLRNGQFQNIEWGNWAAKHEKHWQKLSEKYGLTLAEADSLVDGDAPKTLDFLAQKCVQLCSPYLWGTLDRANMLDSRLRSDLQNYLTEALCDHLIVTFAYRFYCENLVAESREQYWKRVHDDGLGYDESVSGFHSKYRAFEKSIDGIVATYRTMVQTDLDTVRERARSSLDRLQSSCDTKISSSSKEKDTVKQERNARILAQLTANVRDMRQYELEQLKKRGQAVKKTAELLNSNRFKNENLSAPNWIFAFAMASNWSRNPYRIEDGKFIFSDNPRQNSGSNLLERLTDFIAQSEWRDCLIGTQEKSIPLVTYEPTDSLKEQLLEQTASIMEFRIGLDGSSGSAYSEDWKRMGIKSPEPFAYSPSVLCPPIDPTIFVGIACDLGKIAPPKLASQSYILKCALTEKDIKRKHTKKTDVEYKQEQKKRAENSIVIPSEIQYVFNSYLLERNFHGYAIATVLWHIAAHNLMKLSSEQIGQYISTIRVTRLHAPLVHSSLIVLMAQEIKAGRGLYWVEPYIDYMNSVALPVLEELFLREICRTYAADTVQDVFRKIEESFGTVRKGKDSTENVATSTRGVMDSHGIPEVTSKIKEIVQKQEQQSLRCNRLAYYRLVPKGNNHYAACNKNYKQLINQIVVSGYRAAMEMSPSGSDGEPTFQVDLCTAFED